MRKSFLCALAAVILVVPLAAEAGKPKGPFYALVNADGTSGSNSGGIFVNRAFGYPTGVYAVTIVLAELSIESCVAVASPAEGAAGTIGVEYTSNGNYFRVWTTTGGGAALTDLPFYIVVHCPKLKKGG